MDVNEEKIDFKKVIDLDYLDMIIRYYTKMWEFDFEGDIIYMVIPDIQERILYTYLETAVADLETLDEIKFFGSYSDVQLTEFIAHRMVHNIQQLKW